jgi:response regulator NasT
MPMAKLAESIVQADELLELPHQAAEPVRRSSGLSPDA